MNYFFGKPLRATGHLSTLVHRIEVEDNATVMIEYDRRSPRRGRCALAFARAAGRVPHPRD